MLNFWKLRTYNGRDWRHSVHANFRETKKAIEHALHVDRVHRKAAANDPIEAAIQKLLASPESRVAARVKANLKLKLERRERLDTCLKPFSLEDLADEPIHVFGKVKSKGGIRVVSVFGPRAMTAQQLVVEALTPHFKIPPFLYGVKGRGGHHAIAAAKKFIGEGYVWVARLDIQSCFDSFDGEKLVQVLPLPKEWVESVVCRRHAKAVLANRGSAGSSSHYDNTVLMGAHRGIPTGSVCSPLVCAYCVSKLPWKPSEDVKLILYVDDLLVLAKSQIRLQQEVVNLTDAIGKLPGGHFKSSILQVGHVEYFVQFLGHVMWMTGGQLMTEPSDKALNGMYRRAKYLPDPKYSNCHGITLEMLAETWAYVEGWGAAFSECDDVDMCVGQVKERILPVAAKLGMTEEALKAAAGPSREFDFSDFS